jgi:hypothetical protein
MRLGIITLATLVLAAAAVAQNPNAAPAYGTIRLHGIDPHIVRLQSGGRIDASRLGGACSGFIADAPDVRLDYRQSGTLPLIITAVAEADTTLVINAPDGRWHCNDDSRSGSLNPSIRFAAPPSGRYEIWVGTRAGPQLHPARLEISESER